ncbi:MAG: response regulator transcription factor [Rudaea sp.]|uniref:response regulator transcription factor n=1 Tax=Rudaea sp. TaxID=2136325 RepID=UPI0039E4BC8A
MTSDPTDTKRVLLVDDDEVFTRVLARALAARGFEAAVAHDAAQARTLLRTQPFQFAVLDLKLGADNGLALIPELKALHPELPILLLTGYASIATAVEAIKRGADDYLAKPVDADAIVAALLATPRSGEAHGAGAAEVALPHAPPPLKRLEWEHIHRVLAECDGNVSETARRLGLHRRTLQRKLAKHPVRESR